MSLSVRARHRIVTAAAVLLILGGLAFVLPFAVATAYGQAAGCSCNADCLFGSCTCTGSQCTCGCDFLIVADCDCKA